MFVGGFSVFALTLQRRKITSLVFIQIPLNVGKLWGKLYGKFPIPIKRFRCCDHCWIISCSCRLVECVCARTDRNKTSRQTGCCFVWIRSAMHYQQPGTTSTRAREANHVRPTAPFSPRDPRGGQGFSSALVPPPPPPGGS